MRRGVRMALQGSGLVISSDTGRTLTLGSSPATARAGRAVIVGVVIDPAMGEYMRNVSVQIVDAAGVKRTTTSGEGGVFRLTDVAGGDVAGGFAQVTASFAGYPDQISEIELAGGYTAHLDIAMVRESGEAVRVSDVVVGGLLLHT